MCDKHTLESPPAAASRSWVADRRRFAVSAALAGALRGGGFAFSPLIGPITMAFPLSNKFAQIAGGYMYAEALLLFGLSMALLLFHFGHATAAQQRRSLFCSSLVGAAFGPISFIFMAIAVQFNQRWILYVFAGPLFGIMLTCTLLFAVVIVDWYAPDGCKGFGTSIFSTTTGVSAVVFTLVYGSLVDTLSDYPNSTDGLGHALFAVAGVEAVLAIGVAGTTLAGWVKPFHVEDYPDDPIAKQHSCSVVEQTKDNQGDGEEGGKVVTVVLPRPRLSMRQMVSMLDFWLLLAFYFANSFVGIGSNGLLAVMFRDIFQTTYVESYRLAACSLTVFAAVCCVIPLIADRISCVTIILCACLVDTAILGSVQTVIIVTSTPWPFLGCTMFIGGVYAAIQSIVFIVPAEVFGVANIKQFSMIGQVALGLGMAGGVLTGDLLGTYGLITAEEDGTTTEDSFRYFFYMTAGVMLLGGMCFSVVLIRRWRERRQVEKRGEKPAPFGGRPADLAQAQSFESF